MRLVVLVDNEPGPGLRSDWGWSAYIEYRGSRILFDADTDPGVLEYNARRLGVDLGSLDYAVLSHHHFDHYGGFETVARHAPGLRVYVPPSGGERLRAWGLDVVVVDSPRQVSTGAWIVPLRAGLGLYEQALALVLRGRGLVVVVGCSHPGPDRLAEEASKTTGLPVYWVIGGFHGPSRRVLDRLASIAQRLSPAHCSGEEAKRYLREHYPDKYLGVRTGSIIVEEGDD